MVEHINDNDDDDDRYTDSGLLNHPAINSRPLTILPSHSHPNHSSSAASAAAAKTTTTIPTTTVIKLQFINTAYPGESTSAKRISQIRSHVAKDSHARRRQRKAAQARSGTTPAVTTTCTTSSSRGNSNSISPYSSASSSPPYLLAAGNAAQPDESYYSTSASLDGLQHPHQAWHSSTNTGLGRKGFRQIAPKEGAVVRRVASPGPRQMIGDTMKDAWNGQFAWELSLEDYGIFNYCKSTCLTHLCKGACSTTTTTGTYYENLPLSSLHPSLCGSCRSCITAEVPVECALWLLGYAYYSDCTHK